MDKDSSGFSYQKDNFSKISDVHRNIRAVFVFNLILIIMKFRALNFRYKFQHTGDLSTTKVTNGSKALSEFT